MANYKDYLALLGAGTVAYLGYKIYDYIKETKRDDTKSHDDPSSNPIKKTYHRLDFTRLDKVLSKKNLTRKELSNAIGLELLDFTHPLYSEISTCLRNMANSLMITNKDEFSRMIPLTLKDAKEMLQIIKSSSSFKLTKYLSIIKLVDKAIVSGEKSERKEILQKIREQISPSTKDPSLKKE